MSGRIPAEVFPPGEFIRDEIEARGWTQNDLAEILGRPIRLVNEIISGKRSITPETAQGLAAAFGNSAQFWMNLESGYQLSRLKTNEASVVRRSSLYSAAPVKDMVRRGWIEEKETIEGLESEVLRFFGVESVAAIDSLGLRGAARRSTDSPDAQPAQRAWLRRVMRIASMFEVPPYRKEAFGRLTGELKLLMAEAQDVSRVPGLLKSYGIRFVVVEHMPKTRFDGVALWLDDDESDDKPVVAMSLRLDRVDYFWFTLMHELAHILHGDRGPLIDDDLAGVAAEAAEGCEAKANEYARDFLLPKQELDAFIAQVHPFYSKIKINQFARRVGVHPGIVVGRLQFLENIPYSQGRDMLSKVRDAVTGAAVTDGWGHLPGRFGPR